MSLPRFEPQHVHVWAGEDVTLEIPIFDAGGQPVTITGAAVAYSVHYPDIAGCPTDTKLFEKLSSEGDIDVLSQQVNVHIAGADTRARPGAWAHYVSITDAEGAEGVAVWGTLTIGRRPASGG